MFYGRFNTSRHTAKVVINAPAMFLGLVKLILSSTIVDGTVDEESFK